jgi:type I restriction enzyme, S subunit
MPRTPPPKRWTWSPLAALARLESGHTPSRKHPEYWKGPIPWISLVDAKQNNGRRIRDTIEHTNDFGIANSSARVLPANTVCLSRTASVGYVVVMGRPMATSQDFVNWVCSDRIDSDFLKYLFLAEGRGLLRFASGAIHQTIYFPEAKAFHVCHPILSEQRRIVGILDEVFDGITTAKANAEKNLRHARELFRSAYVAVAHEPDHERWLKTTVADVALPKKGSIRTGPFGSQLLHGEFVEEGIAVLGIDNVVHNEFRWGKKRCISPEKFTQLSRYRVSAGDVLITIMGTCGRCAIVPHDIPIAINTKHICCITLDRKKCAPGFLQAYFLYHPIAQEFLTARAKGSIMAGLNMQIIQELPLLLPPLDRQNAIVKKLESFRDETQRLKSIYQRKLTALDALKKSLLHQAFTGQL